MLDQPHTTYGSYGYKVNALQTIWINKRPRRQSKRSRRYSAEKNIRGKTFL